VSSTEPEIDHTVTVDNLRRSLMTDHQVWQKESMKLMKSTAGQTHTETEKIAVTGSMMAANYSYTLAAVLGLAQRIGPLGFAQILANAADEIMSNGDFDGLNSDLREEPSPM
jgi:hypothetical protein